MATLDYIYVMRKGTMREVRKDIWEFAMNFKYYLEKKMDLGRNFREGLKYTGYIGEINWMDSSEMGPIVADFHNIVVYA